MSNSDTSPSAEMVFRDAVSDFEMSVSDYLEDPALNEERMCRARKRVFQLYSALLKGTRGATRNLNEALNSGDGTYKP